jgi:transcriptional regulator with XRE-family HTH domain
MTSSVFTKKYETFRELLTQYRKDAGVTQQSLAEKLDKPQSFVSKFESGERRLDVIEFLDVAEALQFDVFRFTSSFK